MTTRQDLSLDKRKVNSEMERRDFLKTALGALSLAAARTDGLDAGERLAESWAGETCGYLESLRRADGGYAWADQAQSHLTPTFGAVGCYHLLQREPSDKAALVEFLRTHHPFAIKKLERDLPVFEFQQVQSLLWLDQEVGSFREQVEKWTKPSVYPAVYEKHSYPVLQMEVMAFLSRRLAGLPMENVTPTLVTPAGKQGAYQDHYHYYHLPEPAPGKHTATATVRTLATKAESNHTVEFTV